MSVRIIFHLEYYTKPNETVAIVGSLRELGVWEAREAVFGVEKPDGKWEASVVLPRDLPFQYKWVVLDKHHNSVIRWEERDNRTMEISKSAQVYTSWNFGHEILDSDDKNDEDTSALLPKAGDAIHRNKLKGGRNLREPFPKDARDILVQETFGKDLERDLGNSVFSKDARNLNTPSDKNAEGPNTSFAEEVIMHWNKGGRILCEPFPEDDEREILIQEIFGKFTKDDMNLSIPLIKYSEGPKTPFAKEVIEHPPTVVKVWHKMLLMGMFVMLGGGFYFFCSGFPF